MPTRPSLLAMGLGLPHGLLAASDNKSKRAAGPWTGERQVWYSAALVGLFAFAEISGFIKSTDVTTTGVLCGVTGLTQRTGVGVRHRSDAIGAGGFVVASPRLAPVTAFNGTAVDETSQGLAARSAAATVVEGRVLRKASVPAI